MILISVVIPVYKARNIVPELIKRLNKSISFTEDYEIILIEDGCPENSWLEIEKQCEKDKRVKGIKLSRNFGQHYAITAGLEACKGFWVVVMDCDLQDQPEEIKNLYRKALEGFDYVQASRLNRKDKIFKRFSSKLFNFTFRYFSGLQSDSSVSNFGIYNTKVIQSLMDFNDYARSFTSLINQVGFLGTKLSVKHSSRFIGESSYTFSKLLNLSLDIILVNSSKPLKLTVKVGFIISIISFCLAIYNLAANLVGLIKVPGYTSTIFSIWFVGGLILFVLGVIGLYIGKIFDQVKNRPLYIISEKRNLNENN